MMNADGRPWKIGPLRACHEQTSVKVVSAGLLLETSHLKGEHTLLESVYLRL